MRTGRIPEAVRVRVNARDLSDAPNEAPKARDTRRSRLALAIEIKLRTVGHKRKRLESVVRVLVRLDLYRNFGLDDLN
jgi:hypothetical protein